MIKISVATLVLLGLLILGVVGIYVIFYLTYKLAKTEVAKLPQAEEQIISEAKEVISTVVQDNMTQLESAIQNQINEGIQANIPAMVAQMKACFQDPNCG